MHVYCRAHVKEGGKTLLHYEHPRLSDVPRASHYNGYQSSGS